MNSKTGNKNTPMRRCVGCMESKPKKNLVRIAYYEGKLTLDVTGKSRGRGVYICPNPDCMEKAKKRHAITRSLEAQVTTEEIDRIFRELTEYEGKNS